MTNYPYYERMVVDWFNCDLTVEQEDELQRFYETENPDSLTPFLRSYRSFFVDEDDGEDADIEFEFEDFDFGFDDEEEMEEWLDGVDLDEGEVNYVDIVGGEEEEEELSDEVQVMKEGSFDDHSMWPDNMTEEEKENLNQVIDDMLVFAAEEVEKGCGSIPGELVGKITDIRNRKKPKPVADWKKYFRRYIGNEFSDLIKKSRKRESKRFPDAAGNRHKRKSHILVAIDTSGSVSMPEYREFFGQLRTMRKDVSFHVVECDTKIQFEYDFNGTIRDELHGGGGTDFQPPVDMYLANRRKFEGLVYFTDGGAPIPPNTPKETLWVVSSQGDHNRARYKVNGASVVFIPKTNQ